MENFIEKTSHLTEDEINEILYYYQQGIDIGKEETMVKIVNNMSNMSFDVETIAKIVNKTPNQINQYLGSLEQKLSKITYIKQFTLCLVLFR